MPDFDFYEGPGRKQKLTGWSFAAIFVLTLVMGSIIGFSTRMVSSFRITVVRLDPYLKVAVRGADRFGKVSVEFDKAGFAKDLEELLSATDAGERMTEDGLKVLAADAADSVSTGFTIEKNVQNIPDQTDDNESGVISGTGISNGDRISCYGYMEDEAQNMLREKGFVLAFESQRVTAIAEGLPEAELYDPFGDLTVEFEGKSGDGRVYLAYTGPFPLNFWAEPSQELHNGDTIKLCMSPAEEYDLEEIVETFHIMPTSSEKNVDVGGLQFEPASINELSAGILEKLREQGREKVQHTLEGEYLNSERVLSLEETGIFFASRKEETEEDSEEYESEAGNYLFCTYLVHYADDTGHLLDYYYYVRFENLLIDDRDQVFADFDQAVFPRKAYSFWGTSSGEDASVSVPGFLNFRTLAGYETMEQMQEAISSSLEDRFALSQQTDQS